MPKPTWGWRGTLAILFGGIAVLAGGLEWYTLADDVPGNHITAALRLASGTDLGRLVLFAVVGIVCLVAGHAWPRWGGGDDSAAHERERFDRWRCRYCGSPLVGATAPPLRCPQCGAPRKEVGR